MNNDTVLEMRAVSKIYAGHSVLDRLNLEIPAGSVVGLLGKTRARRRSLYGGKKRCGPRHRTWHRGPRD